MSSSHPDATPPRQRRKRGSRAATRQRLLDAAIDIVRKQGIDAMTTVSVTQAAGIVQSGFYVHFQDIEDCKQAAAEYVALGIRQFIAEDRGSAGQTSASDLQPLVHHLFRVLELFQKERRFAELLLRCRYDRSPLGAAMRQFLDQLRADLISDFCQQYSSLLPSEHAPRRIAIYAELVLGMLLAAGEAWIEGRVTDPDLLVRELSIALFAMANGALSSD